jgi:hypothetical protein
MSFLDTKEEPDDPDPRMPKNHRTVTIFLGVEIEADDPGLCHHDTYTIPRHGGVS